MRFIKSLLTALAESNATDYTISESLGQGQQISDDDLFTYVCGSTRHWNRFKRMWIAFVLSRKPWKGEVARMRSDAARVDAIEARDPNFFSLEGVQGLRVGIPSPSD
ncbi:MAG: hypothetical protein KF884_03420 [Fimbriimonadaceae bacterium]|nr:hypothetical protein [Fimbriimonadaceae bacterium]QYK59141.1 MAG: hypothetical protein KF884_03420 [Fimbriimonadaceae bacterium]